MELENKTKKAIAGRPISFEPMDEQACRRLSLKHQKEKQEYEKKINALQDENLTTLMTSGVNVGMHYKCEQERRTNQSLYQAEIERLQQAYEQKEKQLKESVNSMKSEYESKFAELQRQNREMELQWKEMKQQLALAQLQLQSIVDEQQLKTRPVTELSSRVREVDQMYKELRAEVVRNRVNRDAEWNRMIQDLKPLINGLAGGSASDILSKLIAEDPGRGKTNDSHVSLIQAFRSSVVPLLNTIPERYHPLPRTSVETIINNYNMLTSKYNLVASEMLDRLCPVDPSIAGSACAKDASAFKPSRFSSKLNALGEALFDPTKTNAPEKKQESMMDVARRRTLSVIEFGVSLLLLVKEKEDKTTGTLEDHVSQAQTLYIQLFQLYSWAKKHVSELIETLNRDQFPFSFFLNLLTLLEKVFPEASRMSFLVSDWMDRHERTTQKQFQSKQACRELYKKLNGKNSKLEEEVALDCTNLKKPIQNVETFLDHTLSLLQDWDKHNTAVFSTQTNAPPPSFT